MNFCWCADPSDHMLSIHLHGHCKWSLNITIASEEISPCYGNSLPQQSNGLVLMVSLYSVSMADALSP